MELEQLRQYREELAKKDKATADAHLQAAEAKVNAGVYLSILSDISKNHQIIESHLAELESETKARHAEQHRLQLSPATAAEKVATMMASVEEVLQAEELLPGEKHKIVSQIIRIIEPLPDYSGYSLDLSPWVNFSYAELIVQMNSMD